MTERYTNPTDVLQALVLMDDITAELKICRAGLKSLRRSWGTSSAGLLTAARAASSAVVLMEEFSALLSFMGGNVGVDTPEQRRMPLPSLER